MPAARVGVTALRPTFGMVGRSWTMTLSESLVGGALSEPCIWYMSTAYTNSLLSPE
jgi:hypothetical protein